MADELKDQRVVTMMAPSELESIDDWMFQNRIRSRGEAIRRLCQLGLNSDERASATVDHLLAASRAALDLAEAIDRRVNEVLSANKIDPDAVLDLVDGFSQALKAMFDEQTKAITELHGVAALSTIFKQHSDTEMGRAGKVLRDALARKLEELKDPDQLRAAVEARKAAKMD